MRILSVLPLAAIFALIFASIVRLERDRVHVKCPVCMHRNWSLLSSVRVYGRIALHECTRCGAVLEPIYREMPRVAKIMAETAAFRELAAAYNKAHGTRP